MPNPIPNWDLARRLVKHIGLKQIIGEVVTVREATVTLGIGRERMEAVMKEKKIIYKIIPSGEASGKDLVLIEYVPHNLALDAGLSNRELDTSYRKFLDRQQSGEILISKLHRKRKSRKQRDRLRVNEFWGGPEHVP